MTTDNQPPSTACPCGSGVEYSQCCEPLHKGEPARNAEALMRSRYTAFALGLQEYLLKSWHASTRPAQLDLGEGNARPRWLGLRIKRHETIDADHARVQFMARCRVSGRESTVHEISRFVRENGHWYYVDGIFPRR